MRTWSSCEAAAPAEILVEAAAKRWHLSSKDRRNHPPSNSDEPHDVNFASLFEKGRRPEEAGLRELEDAATYSQDRGLVLPSYSVSWSRRQFSSQALDEPGFASSATGSGCGVQ